MIVLFIDMSFVIGCVDRMYQSFLSGCLMFFPSIVFGFVVVMDIQPSLPVGDKFFWSLDNGFVSWLLDRDKIFN